MLILPVFYYKKNPTQCLEGRLEFIVALQDLIYVFIIYLFTPQPVAMNCRSQMENVGLEHQLR
jgi:hypothetical protein